MSKLQSARNEFQAGNFDVCVQFCESELATHPQSLDALTILAYAHLRAGNKPLARDALNRLLAAAPPNLDVTKYHRYLGTVCTELKDIDRAINAFVHVIGKQPDDVFSLAHTVHLAYSSGNLELSRQCAEQLRNPRADDRVGM